jgi:hypothetical protein
VKIRKQSYDEGSKHKDGSLTFRADWPGDEIGRWFLNLTRWEKTQLIIQAYERQLEETKMG